VIPTRSPTRPSARAAGARSANIRRHSDPTDAPRDERGFPHGPAWDAWIAELEAANDACWDDWRVGHFDPLLGYEPHTQLIEAADAGGRRHYLDGRPVHAGTTLELLLPDGDWLTGHYEWGYVAGEAPTLHVALGGPRELSARARCRVVPAAGARGASVAA
jgi:hypothetical protein